MRKYYPQFHTQEALSGQIAEVYSAYPNTFLVGSLGRATIYKSFGRDPFTEFIERLQHPLYNRQTARDIDVIGVEPEFAMRTLPFWVDATSYDIGGTQLTEQNGEWFIAAYDSFHSPLHPTVMEPIVTETIYDIPCTTVPPETQLALLKLRGKFRDKDVQTFSLLSDLLEVKGRQLPSELYVPFEQVHEINVARFS